ncbi:MAG: hypothetical protein WKG01_08745 [Kofleriaceae bacterium]
MRRWLPVVLVLAMSPRAFADDAAAKALFDRGKALFAEGRYGDACLKLEASFKLNPLSGTRGLLGACYEKVGRLASAWAAFRDAATLAERQGNAERAQASREKAAELEPRLARITIQAAALPDLEVAVDGAVQPRGAFGSAVPIDAGPHVVTATAFDHKPWRTTFELEDGEHHRIAVPALAADHSGRLAEHARRDAIRTTVRRRKLLAYGLGAGGGLTLGVAGTLAILARGDWAAAREARCTEAGVCPVTSARELGQSAARKANLASILAGGGLVLVGVGVAIYFTAPSERVYESPRVVPAISPTAAGLALEGSF